MEKVRKSKTPSLPIFRSETCESSGVPPAAERPLLFKKQSTQLPQAFSRQFMSPLPPLLPTSSLPPSCSLLHHLLPLNPTPNASSPSLSSMEFDLENPLNPCHDTLPSLFLVEPDHMPSREYVKGLRDGGFDAAVRREIVSSISRLSSGFDPLSSYLAVNYLDRFLSRQSLPHSSPWVLRLLAVCCVSLAAKMRNTDFSLADFQGDGGFIPDSRTIQRMEVLILGALKWRMRSVTPFSFVAFFTSLFKLKDPPLRQALNARATEIIFKSQKDIELMDVRPSVIAASALLSASHELFPLQFSCFRTAILNCSYVNKDEFLDCYRAMQDVAMEGYESVFDTISRSDTPINVLDQSFSVSEDGDEKPTGGGSGAISTSTITRTSLRPERLLKRRKVSDPCCDSSHTFQLSQFQQC